MKRKIIYSDKTGLLDGKEAVRAYLDGPSDHTLKKYIALGMPVLILSGGRWLAHKENIEAFFITITRVKALETDAE